MCYLINQTKVTARHLANMDIPEVSKKRHYDFVIRFYIFIDSFFFFILNYFPFDEAQ